jgi:hypothetical protein
MISTAAVPTSQVNMTRQIIRNQERPRQVVLIAGRVLGQVGTVGGDRKIRQNSTAGISGLPL